MSDWSTDDPQLEKPHLAPHEPAAVMRLRLAGHPPQAILQEIRVKGTEFVKQIEQAKIEIDEAAGKGRPIHDALIPKEKS